MAAVRLRLRELLNERNLTQKELAHRAGLTELTISRMLRSPTMIKLDSVNSICNALDIQPGDLLERTTDKPN